MDTQNRSQREKFPQPRGWAVNWVFAQEIAAQLAGQVQQDPGSPPRQQFTEPRGWAMKWDGFALSKAQGQREKHE
jgi:hypothetical protein